MANSLDGVSDRDFALETLAAAALGVDVTPRLRHGRHEEPAPRKAGIKVADVAELVSKTSKIGSHIERVASAAGECGLATRQSAHPASTLPGGSRLDGEVAHFRLA